MIKMIYPVSRMIENNPWLIVAIPEDERNIIISETLKWTKIQCKKPRLPRDSNAFPNESMASQNISSAIRERLKHFSKTDDYPLYGDPISKAVYGFVEKLNSGDF